MAEVGAVMQLAGGFVGAAGQIAADEAEAEAEIFNAQFFDEQERNIRLAAAREEDIFEREAEALLGEQRSIFAKSGITLDNTALELQRQTRDRAKEEIVAIRTFRDQNARLAQIRSMSARRRAIAIRETIGLRATGTILGATGRSFGGGGFDNVIGSNGVPDRSAGASTKNIAPPGSINERGEMNA